MPPPSKSLFTFSVITAGATLGLICLGGLVTSKGVGMSVPDWPTSFGYNMFALPVQQWFHGGVFDEHTHRLWASTVGLLVVILIRWLGGSAVRKPLAQIGGAEVLAGLALLTFGPAWRGVGHFLMGIGGVVLLAAVVWVRHEPAPGILPKLGWLAFWAVQLQGLLGGLRVVLDQWMIGHVTLGLIFGLFHGCLGQVFFVLLGVIALLLSPFWRRLVTGGEGTRLDRVRGFLWAGTALIALQLLLGATMRHQHAGLAIPDFPLAYGGLWPATDAEALLRYNQNRVDESTVTAFQISLQMLHRLGAVAAVGTILAAFGAAFRDAGWRSPITRGSAVWAGLLALQFGLGATIIWTHKAADVATLHVAVGAIALLTGTLLIVVARKLSLPGRAVSVTGPAPGLVHSVPR